MQELSQPFPPQEPENRASSEKTSPPNLAASTTNNPPSEPLNNFSKKSTSLFIYWGIAILLIAGIGVGAYFYQQTYFVNTSMQNETVDKKQSPTSLPSPTPDVLSGWKVYSDIVGKFDFQYPADYDLDTSAVAPSLNRKISWRYTNTSYAQCKGDCLVISATEDKTISGIASTKIRGYFGDVGGGPAQSIIQYEIPVNTKFLVFTLHELPIVLTEEESKKYSGHTPQPITATEEAIFDQILSTLKISTNDSSVKKSL